MIVVCTKRQGLIASLSRIICDGKIPAELRKRTDACARVNAKILAATKQGATSAGLYKIAADAYRRKILQAKKNCIIKAARQVTKHAIGSRIRIRRKLSKIIRRLLGILR